MNYTYIGMSFLKIAAFLFAARFVAAGAYMGGAIHGQAGGDLFRSGYNYVGNDLTVAAGIAAALGIAALAMEFKKNDA